MGEEREFNLRSGGDAVTALRGVDQAVERTMQNFRTLEASVQNSLSISQWQQFQTTVININADLSQTANQINIATESQDRLTESVRSTGAAAEAAEAAMEKISSALDLKKLAELSDAMTRSRAQLALIAGEGQGAAQIQGQIYEAAQRSGIAYQSMADSVAQLGLAAGGTFMNTDELVAFAETYQKMAALSGAAPDEAAAGMAQLTQGMQSGGIDGGQYADMLTESPLLAQAIADYVGVGIDEMQSLADQSVITADVIKNAVFMAADGVEERFAQLPATWSQVWTQLQNGFLLAVEPILSAISFLADNWTALEPVVLGAAAAIGVYALSVQMAALWQSLLTAGALLNQTAMAIQAVGYALLAMATGDAAYAQMALNAAQSASPMGLILLLIGLIVAAIVKWVQSVGGLQVAWITVVNGILDLLGTLKLMGLQCIQGLVNGAVDLVNTLIGLLNRIPGVNIEANFEHVDLTSEYEGEFAVQRQERALKLDEARRNAQVSRQQWTPRDESSPTGQAPAQIAAGISRTADNTSMMADNLTASEEDLKYLLDVAEQEAVNRFTTAEIKVDMANSFGDIKESADIDGVINRLTERLEQQLAVTAEGVHV